MTGFFHALFSHFKYFIDKNCNTNFKCPNKQNKEKTLRFEPLKI